jgi:nuclear protein localization protein 4 homolog
MLLRFESKWGQFRLTVEPTDHFSSLSSQVGNLVETLSKVCSPSSKILDHLPPNTDATTIVLSNKPVSSTPDPGRERRLADLPGVELRQVGLKYVFSEEVQKC